MNSLAENEKPGDQFVQFIRQRAPSARGAIEPPTTLKDWDQRLADVKEGLRRSFGRMPEQPCPLDPVILGTILRDGYAIDRLTFQSRPGVLVTANLYRPDPLVGRAPALLSVHGHWAWARMDPHVQPRCIALAKMGYVVLCVDAFGAGERAIEPGAGTYHGALVGASLWPTGTPLIGLQVYDNRRAVDYLISRPDVDATKLAITGASGGGNQTLYAGATDDRLAAVVPVCGIGTYESYLSAACCVCEVNVGGLTYAVTGDLLAMTAPRALMVVNATRDAFQFSVEEAKKSIDYARERYRLLGQPDRIRHVAVESGHDYNRAMREALYGWLEKWLRNKGDGSPIPEPELKVEDPATLRCFPDGPSRPKAVVTIPQFARQEGNLRLAALPKVPDHRERWQAEAIRMSNGFRDVIFSQYPPTIRDTVLGGTSSTIRGEISRRDDSALDHVALTTEPGITVIGTIVSTGKQGTVLYLGDEPTPANGGPPRVLSKQQLQSSTQESNLGWFEVGLRAVGPNKPSTAPVVGVPDHNEAEWCLWVGRPLLGQWVQDTIRWMNALDEWRLAERPLPTGRPFPARPYILCATGPLSLVALATAALDPRVDAVFISGGLVSFVAESDRSWSKVPMGIIAPNILNIADIAQIAGLIAPRKLVIADAATPEGERATPERLRSAFSWTRRIYALLGAERKFILGAEPDQLSTIVAS